MMNPKFLKSTSLIIASAGCFAVTASSIFVAKIVFEQKTNINSSGMFILSSMTVLVCTMFST
ncbi:hypothetical protein [Wolbachia endosymbiont of Pentidionis agamae]|uniref:hypothetical protein n=1 Tax=Wolbachia endosymbiont of Pentidionis agamae TaxID=3110435 RepID=UPI002FD07BD8